MEQYALFSNGTNARVGHNPNGHDTSVVETQIQDIHGVTAGSGDSASSTYICPSVTHSHRLSTFGPFLDANSGSSYYLAHDTQQAQQKPRVSIRAQKKEVGEVGTSRKYNELGKCWSSHCNNCGSMNHVFFVQASFNRPSIYYITAWDRLNPIPPPSTLHSIYFPSTGINDNRATRPERVRKNECQYLQPQPHFQEGR